MNVITPIGFPQKTVKMLAVSAARLGDALFCTPVYRTIKRQCPQIELDVISLNSLTTEILQRNPNIHRIIQNPTDAELTSLQGYYQLGFNIHPSPTATRIYDELCLPLIQLPKHKPGQHKTETLLEGWKSVTGLDWHSTGGHYDLFPEQSDYQAIESLLEQKGCHAQSDWLIGLHLGCHGLSKGRFPLFGKLQHKKVWPIEHFVTLAKTLMGRHPNLKILLTGSKNEEPLAQKIQKQCPQVISLMSATTVNQLRALMDYLKVYLSSDTGALHVAAASAVQIIALFRSAEVHHTGPYPYVKDRHHVLHRPCVADIPVQDVINAADYCLINHHALSKAVRYSS